jgi:predicted PhzF superfamily epimerase YddE/YHI9
VLGQGARRRGARHQRELEAPRQALLPDRLRHRTNRRFAGNQLAIFPAAGGLSGEQMQTIAREIGYSETTFIVGRSASTAQGVEMGRPSELSSRLERDPDGEIRARVGGGVVPVIRGTMTL